MAERDDIRKKIIQFQLVNYMSAGTKLEEAKTKLKKRYELIARRVSESKEADDYSMFLNIFASALDPHSSYFSKDDLEDFRINMGLSLEGLGPSCKIEMAIPPSTKLLLEVQLSVMGD